MTHQPTDARMIGDADAQPTNACLNHPSLPPDLITRLEELYEKGLGPDAWGSDWARLANALIEAWPILRKAFPLARGEEVENCDALSDVTQPEPRSSLGGQGAITIVSRHELFGVPFVIAEIEGCGFFAIGRTKTKFVLHGDTAVDAYQTATRAVEFYRTKPNEEITSVGETELATQFSNSLPPRQEPETAKLIEALRSLLDDHHIMYGVRVLNAREALSTALARSQAAPMAREETT
jgi:hypothetical protein